MRVDGDHASLRVEHLSKAHGDGTRALDALSIGTESANVSGEYRCDLDDFVELCIPCHRERDRAARAAPRRLTRPITDVVGGR